MRRNKRFSLSSSLKKERRKRKKRIKLKKKNLKIEKKFLKDQVYPKNYYGIDRIKNIRFRKKLKTKNLIAPSNLYLQLGYSEEVLNFIKLLKEYGEKYDHINLVLDNVKRIGEGAIAMLLSVINELTAKNIIITGTKPTEPTVRNVLEKSGFFKYMRGIVSPENLNTKNIIIRTGDINTSQKELSPEMPKAMETVWGVKGRCPELFGVIGEMLRNSCDHAFSSDKKIIWHLGISHIEEENTVKFSFVDNGIGIISKYNERSSWGEIFSFFKNNAKILENAYKKGIESQTGLPWRGQGLPTIYELYQDKVITNLVVITNNVYLDFDSETYKEINISFSGTYYFWKINRDCKESYHI